MYWLHRVESYYVYLFLEKDGEIKNRSTFNNNLQQMVANPKCWEIQLLLSLMRQNNKWKITSTTITYEKSSTNSISLIKSLELLRIYIIDISNSNKENESENNNERCLNYDYNILLSPFSNIIKSEETSGVITNSALNSIIRFINHGLFNYYNSMNYNISINNIIDSVCNCRFESTSSSYDEVVYLSILQFLYTTVKSYASIIIDEKLISSIINTFFKMHILMRPPQYSIVLCDAAASFLYDIIATLFNDEQSKINRNSIIVIFQLIVNSALESCKDPKPYSNYQLSLCLSLLNAIFSTVNTSFFDSPDAQNLLSTDIIKVILECSRLTQNSPPITISAIQPTVLLASVTRLFYQIYVRFRTKLFIQIELVFNSVYLRLLNNKNLSLDMRELITESLYDFCQLPYFLKEMFFNFDCEIRCSNIAQSLIQYLARASFPTTLQESKKIEINQLHFIALKCLIALSKQLKSTECDNSNVFLKRLSNSHLKSELAEVVEDFNKKPKIGIQSLAAKNIIKAYNLDEKGKLDTCDDSELEKLALWCRITIGLNKVELGDFLSENTKLSKALLIKFVKLFNFTGHSLDYAVRIFLESFRLPGEAQLIDRLIQAFSDEFCLQNTGLFHSSSTAYILTFSLIMLNTDLHHTALKKKMTLEEFINNNRGIDDGANVPREYLIELYNSIGNNEIKMADDSSSGFVTDSLFTDLIDRFSTTKYYTIDKFSNSIDYTFVEYSYPEIEFQSFLISKLWYHLMASLSIVFDIAASDPGGDLMIFVVNGFETLEMLAIIAKNDAMVIELLTFVSKFTGLIDEDCDVNESTLFPKLPSDYWISDLFRFSAKSHAAYILFSHLIRIRCKELPASSWPRVILVLMQCYRLNLMPEIPFGDANNDFVADALSIRNSYLKIKPNSRRARFMFKEYTNESKPSGGFFNSIGKLFSTNSNSNIEPIPFEHYMNVLNVARNVYETDALCDVLVSESRFMTLDSLKGLLDAIWRSSVPCEKVSIVLIQNEINRERQDPDDYDFAGIDEDLSIDTIQDAVHRYQFGWHLWSSVLLQNKDRLDNIWADFIYPRYISLLLSHPVAYPLLSTISTQIPNSTNFNIEFPIICSWETSITHSPCTLIFETACISLLSISTNMITRHNINESNYLHALWFIDSIIEPSKSNFVTLTSNFVTLPNWLVPNQPINIKVGVSSLFQQLASLLNDFIQLNHEFLTNNSVWSLIFSLLRKLLFNGVSYTGNYGYLIMSLLIGEINSKFASGGPLHLESNFLNCDTFEIFVVICSRLITSSSNWCDDFNFALPCVNWFRLLFESIPDVLFKFASFLAPELYQNFDIKLFPDFLELCFEVDISIENKDSFAVPESPIVVESLFNTSNSLKFSNSSTKSTTPSEPLFKSNFNFPIPRVLNFTKIYASILQPLLKELKSLATDPRPMIRDAGLMELRHILLLSNPSILEKLPPLFWKLCLNDYIFPILSTLSVDSSRAGAISKSRVMAVELLSKIFLKYVVPHYNHPQICTSFHMLFLNTLTTLERNVQLGLNTSLADTSCESVKNILLVMNSHSIFDKDVNSTADELFELSWAIVDPFYPTLKAEIFPTIDKSVVPLHIEKLLDSSLESMEQSSNNVDVIEEKNDNLNLELPTIVDEVLSN